MHLTHSLDTLDNGLSVLRVPMVGVSSVTVLVLANTGSRYEAPPQYGLAHFFEHLVFKGSHNYPTAQVLATTIDGIGADFNAFTGKEYTGYFVKAAARHTELVLDVVSDMLLTPKLRQEDIDREKGVIIEEIHLYEDTPQDHVGNLWDRMAFAGSGLGHDIIGSQQTVSGMRRADFQGFLRDWYGLPNLLLVLAGDAAVVGGAGAVGDAAVVGGAGAVGDAAAAGGARMVSDDRILKQAEAAFNKIDSQTAQRVETKVAVRDQLAESPLAADPFSAEQRLRVEYRQTEQAHLVLGWPGVSRHDQRRYAVSLLGMILGGNMSSRLFNEIREKRGLAYYVRTELGSYHETGVFGTVAGVDPRRVKEALEVTMAEFHQLVNGDTQKLITLGELARAKEYAAGKMALQYEDPQALAQYYGLKQLLQDEIETVEAVLDKLRAVTLDEVQTVAEDLIQLDQLRLAVIGPFEDQAEFENFL